MLNRRSVRIFGAGGNSSGDFPHAKDDVGRGGRAQLRLRDVRRRLGQRQEVGDADGPGPGATVAPGRSRRAEEGGRRAGEGRAGAAERDTETEGAGGRAGAAPRTDRQGRAGAARCAAGDEDGADGSQPTAAAGDADAAHRVAADAELGPAETADVDAGAERARHGGSGGQRPAPDPHTGQGPAAAPDHRFHRGDVQRADDVRVAAPAGQRGPRQLPDGRRQSEGPEDRRYFEELAVGPAEVADSSSLITAPPFITKGTRSRTRTSFKGSPGTAIRSA